MTLKLKPQIVQGDDWLQRIARFRVEVWLLNDMIDPSSYPDGCCMEEADRTATHIVVEIDNRLVGATRVTHHQDIYSSHNGDYYRAAGIELEGPITIPERMVVHPDVKRKGIYRVLSDEILRQAKKYGSQHAISECTPAAADMLRQRGRKSLGMAPHDPRFPNTSFEWMLTDIELIAKGAAVQPVNKQD